MFSALTHGRWLVAKVSCLVSSEQADGTRLGSRALGKTGVEVDDTLHSGGVLGGTEALDVRRKKSGD